MGSLDGKIGLIVGVANKRSLAWAIAQAAAREGAQLLLTYQERFKEHTEELAATLSPSPSLLQCDVQDDAQIDAVFARIAGAGGLDFLVHGVAFASRDDLSNPFSDTTREGFKTAMDISAYSLIALARGARPLFEARGGGSIVTLSFLGSDRVFPNYNVMGVAKAALESTVRYLAADLGPQEHPRQRGLGGPGEDAGGRRHRRVLDHPRRRAREGAAAADDRGVGSGRGGGVPARPGGQRHHRRSADGRRRVSRRGDVGGWGWGLGLGRVTVAPRLRPPHRDAHALN